MKIDKNKYELACARAQKGRKDLVATGIPSGTLGRIFTKELRPETIGRIAAALGVDVTEILADE